MTDETYEVRYLCANCGAISQKRYPKGRAAPGQALCDTCGCLAANKWVTQTKWNDLRFNVRSSAGPPDPVRPFRVEPLRPYVLPSRRPTTSRESPL